MIASLELLARFVVAVFDASIGALSLAGSATGAGAAQSLGALALVGVIALAGGAVVATSRLVVRIVAALLGAMPTERSAEPAPVPFLRTQDDPTAEGHPRPRAPGLPVPVAAR